jgi:hypothetical protein
MDELINMVSQKVGISAEQATTAVTTVLGFIKDKLPEPIASQVDNVMKGNVGDVLGSVTGGLGDVAKGVGGMLGGE